MRGRTSRAATCVALTLVVGCTGATAQNQAVQAGGTPAASRADLACDPGNGGITLPTGFCALVVADSVGRARHVAIAANGDIYVALQAPRSGAAPTAKPGGVLGLRDRNGDGRADERVYFGPAEGGSGLFIQGSDLFFATNSTVLRWRLGAELQPAGRPDTLVAGLPSQGGHVAKSVVASPQGALFVNIGSATNACQAQDRVAGVKGQDPCPELPTRAGIWRFDANRQHQRQEQGQHWATGIRNAVAMTWNVLDNSLWVMQHGRDQLNIWEAYSDEDNAERPAEELLRLDQAGKDFGWPYCFFDLEQKRRVTGPEYEGTSQAGVCAQKDRPVFTFPAHWAPNGLLFYSGTQFPAHYRGGAFVAFHGSWNRAPLPQDGFRIAFVPFANGVAADRYEVFADGFAGASKAQGTTAHQPVGLVQRADGSLYVTDDVGGRIWRIVYTGP